MRIALITDIHEDIESLEKAFQRIDKNNCDEIVCLGDFSGFSENFFHVKSRNAKACLELIRGNCKIIIAGNHDLFAAKQLPQNSPGFIYPKDWYKMDVQQQFKVSEGKVWLYEDEDPESNLTESDLDFIRSLPESEILDTEYGKIHFSHYAFPNVTGSMSNFYDSVKLFSGHLQWVKEQQCSLSFCGHHHPSGVIYITRKKFQVKRFRTKIKIGNDSLVILPPIVRHKVPNGFCIFDTLTNKLEIKRV